jgi:hypothetical protein
MQSDEWTNGFSIDDGTAIHVPCLNDAYLEGAEHVHAWGQDFFSPVTGAYHISVRMQGESQLHDQEGNVWLGKCEAGFEGDLWSRDSGQHVARCLCKPVVGDGPMWRGSNNGKLTVNANGRVVVDRPPAAAWEDTVSCLPTSK